ncbi:MAG: anion permease [Bryobacterales bacterium]|nr:anion permease [Bryobacterales bacterium]
MARIRATRGCGRFFSPAYIVICIVRQCSSRARRAIPGRNYAANAVFPITWARFCIVPGLCSIFLAPHCPHSAAPSSFPGFRVARGSVHGPQHDAFLRLSFSVCLAWVTSGTLHKVDITVTALIGCCVLLLSGVLTWEDVKNERALWDIFIWYGGLVKLGRALNDAGVTQAFANSVGATFSAAGWVTLFAVALVIYFYTHYAFASITAHILAMYPPFLAVLIAKGAPIGLVAFSFAIFVNLAAGLTHYGTTPSPMYFAMEYVSMKDWWKIGFAVSLSNLLVWGTIGFAWWKLLGIW